MPKAHKVILPLESKSFFEKQILDLNTKLANLLSVHEGIEEQRNEAENKFKCLSEDRADVIGYLQTVLAKETTENKIRIKTVHQLQEKLEEEKEKHMALIKRLKGEFKLLEVSLRADIQMLNGQLSAMDGFRQERENLMEKYAILEELETKQEIRHKNEVYESERKLVIEKEQLKIDMQERLEQLSSDLQNVTNFRLLATNQKVIINNMERNNQLNVALNTYRALSNENVGLKDSTTFLKFESEFEDKEKQQVVLKTSSQMKYISTLTTDIEDMQKQLIQSKEAKKVCEDLKIKLNTLTDSKCNLEVHSRLLEQTLHDILYQRGCLKTEIDYYNIELNRLLSILDKSLMYINVDLMKEPTLKKHTSKKIPNRETLVQNLLSLINKARQEKTDYPTLESVDSISKLYSKGEMGLTPKLVTWLPNRPYLKEDGTVIGPSFEELLKHSKSEFKEND